MRFLRASWLWVFVSFLLALGSYFYLHNAIEKAEKRQTDPSYKLIKLTAKKLPVRVRLATAPKEGYRIVEDSVSSKPEQVIVVGPEALLEEAQTAETALIDISESTGSVKKRIPLESVAGIHLTGDPYNVEITVPIEEAKSSS